MRTPKRGRVVWGLVAMVSTMVGAVLACSGSSSTPLETCNSGDTRACVGPGACAGGQTCSGGAWSACDCGGTDDAGTDGSAALDSGVEAGPDITPYLKNCPQVVGQAPMVEVPASGGGTFCIDTREVTAAELLSAQNSSPLVLSMTPSCQSVQPPPAYLNCTTQDRLVGDLPANCVPWCDAQAYCTREGKRLCTEPEFASACMPNGVDFPWGEDANATFASCFGVGPQSASQSTCHPSVEPNYFVKDLAATLFEWTSTLKERASPTYPQDGGVCTSVTKVLAERQEQKNTSFRCCADKQ